MINPYGYKPCDRHSMDEVHSSRNPAVNRAVRLSSVLTKVSQSDPYSDDFETSL